MTHRFDDSAYDVALLDDDDAYRDLFERKARQSGLAARTDGDPRRFIERFEDAPARVSLIDLNMTDPFGVAWRFAGVSTLIEFRRRHGDANTLWVLSGMQNPGIFSMCRRAGADDVLTKSLSFDAVIARVKTEAERAQYRDAPPRLASDQSRSEGA